MLGRFGQPPGHVTLQLMHMFTKSGGTCRGIPRMGRLMAAATAADITAACGELCVESGHKGITQCHTSLVDRHHEHERRSSA